VKKFSSSTHGTLNELNITPLLDLVFVLLVIFIITTPQLVNELEMNLPTPKTNKTPPGPPPKLNYFTVMNSGEIAFNDRSYTLTDLRPLLVQMQSENPKVNVVIKSEPNATYQSVISLLDVLQQTEVTNVGLATATETVMKQ
jgi:biopolymer transport protein ExbD